MNSSISEGQILNYCRSEKLSSMSDKVVHGIKHIILLTQLVQWYPFKILQAQYPPYPLEKRRAIGKWHPFQAKGRLI